jgi:hypothetical protein
MTRRPPALPVVAAAAMLAGCGSSPAPSTLPVPVPRSADQLYAAYVAALRAARSEHYTGTVTFSDGTSVRLEVTATQTTAHLIAHSEGLAIEEVVAGGHVYQRGGGHGPDWVELPADEAQAAEALTIQREADCAAREHGTLRLGPPSRIGGRRVATIVDDGAGAGAAPQDSYLSLDAPVHLVRVVQTGPEHAGGSAECGHQPGPIAVSATVDYDSFDTPVRITPPPDAADLNAQTA